MAIRRGARAGLVLALVTLLLGGCAGTRRGPATPGPEEIAAARAAGERAYAAADWAAAEPPYRVLVQAIPQDAELWFRLGNVYARLDRPDAAVAAYREALVRDGDLAKAWFNMGVVQLRQAANSFLRLEAHVAPGDAVGRQGAEAHAAIMAILGRHEDGEHGASAPVGHDE
ncbi:MAG: tetratricopeptide repeat protein [Gammaproteobacteria bacterium]